MLQKKLKEYAVNETFEGFLLIRAFAVKTGQTGKSYVDMTLADDQSEMNAKDWNYNEEQFADFKPNRLVKVRATVTQWQNVNQLRIERIRLATDRDPVSLSDFVPSAPKPCEEMMQTLESYLDRIVKDDIRELTRWVVEKKREKLMFYPAAQSNHHSVRGGLLYHTTTMLSAADALAKIYTDLDTDWLFAGCILHDIEKTEEMDAGELGLVSGYSRKGLLLGHIVQGPLTIAEAGRAVGADDQTVLLLQHMLISHHYEPEYGAVKRPMFPEAELLHYLDMIDARLFDFRKALADIPEGGFTEKQWLLENRRLYKVETSAPSEETEE